MVIKLRFCCTNSKRIKNLHGSLMNPGTLERCKVILTPKRIKYLHGSLMNPGDLELS